MSFENWEHKEPELIPMDEVHEKIAIRAVDSYPDEENFDVNQENGEGEEELSPADQDIYDYVVKGMESGKKEDFSAVQIDNPEGLLTKIGRKFGGMKSRLLIIGALLAGGAAAGKVNAQDSNFDELHSRVNIEKAEGKSASVDEQYRQLRKDIDNQEKNMKEIFGPDVDLSGGKEAKSEKQEKISIDFDKFFHSQFPAAKEIKVIKQGEDCVANIDGKIYVGSASAGADEDLARQKAVNSADAAKAKFLAGNFEKTESFVHVNMSGGGAPMEKVSEGKDGYTYFVFYGMGE